MNKILLSLLLVTPTLNFSMHILTQCCYKNGNKTITINTNQQSIVVNIYKPNKGKKTIIPKIRYANDNLTLHAKNQGNIVVDKDKSSLTFNSEKFDFEYIADVYSFVDNQSKPSYYYSIVDKNHNTERAQFSHNETKLFQ